MILSTILCICVTLLLLCVYNCTKPKNFPPGPRWFPLIGCFLVVQKLRTKYSYIHLAFDNLSKTYGPILGLKLGMDKFVIISSNNLVKKVLSMDEFNGRPNGFFFRVRSFGKDKGVLFTEGAIWSQLRKFTMRHLKLFGLGKDLMEQQLTIEAQYLVESLKAQSKNGPVLMHNAFDIAVLNSLWTMFAGHRFDYNDKKLQDILHVVHEVFKLSDTLGGIVSYMPFLRFIFPEWSGYKKLMTNLHQLWAFIDDEITDHEISLPENQPRDLIDSFLMEIKARKNETCEAQSIFDRENLMILCLDLFLAGSKTTTDTLAMIIAFLALNPKWIKELQSELNEVVGRDRLPTLADINSLPKIEAFMAEAQRTLISAPLGVPHKTTKDVLLNEYLIPKNTVVLLNYFNAQNDPSCWENPEEFRPERFLNKEGKFRQANASIPFGFGKRRCMGEGLARYSLFLYFVYVLHYFDLEIDEEKGKPDLNGYDGFVISPKPYYLKLTLRAEA